MEKEDRELIKLLNDSKKGNKNSFEKLTRLVYQEVYNLVAFVYTTKESREKLTKHVLVRMFKNASEFDNEELDIHLWIARFTTVEVYNVCKKQNGELFDTQISAEEYNYDSISEDSEFAKCAADYNQAFLDIDQLNEIMTDFEDFSKGQRLLYLMFAYESYTIDEIEDLLEIDSTFIGTQIMQIRGMLGLDMVSLDGDGPQVHVADEDSSEDETDDETDDEDSSDDSVPEIDFDDNDNYSDRYDAKSANHGIKADARMRGIIAICAALVVVLAVVTVAIAGRIKKNKSKSTFNPTPVTTAAEEATTKKSSKNNNATTKAAETTTTKSAETDEQTEAATTRRTQTKTNDTEATGDNENNNTSDDGNTEDGGNPGTGDSGSTDGSGSGDSGDIGGSGSGDSGNAGGSGSGDSGSTDGSGSGDSGNTGGSGSGDSGSTGGSGSGDSGSTDGSGSGDSGNTGGSGSGDSGSTGGSGSGDSGSTGGSGSGDSGSTGGSGSGDSGNTSGSESGSETGSSEAAGN